METNIIVVMKIVAYTALSLLVSEVFNTCIHLEGFDVFLTVHHSIGFSKYQLSAQFF